MISHKIQSNGSYGQIIKDSGKATETINTFELFLTISKLSPASKLIDNARHDRNPDTTRGVRYVFKVGQLLPGF